MANTLKIKRGAAATIPQGQLAEPLFTTDTYDLYIGKGSGGNQRFQKYIASGTSSQFLKGDGSLDSTSYQTALTFSSPLVNTSGTVSIPVATGSVDGYLSSTDWTTFNSKEPAITAGTTLQYYRGDKTFQTLDTSVVPENGPVYFTEPKVRATVLTGLNLTGGGTIAATDSVLTAFGKVQNQISALVGGATYQGVWNASTNTPTLASGTGTKGYYFVVNVAGSTNLDGITDWKIGDWAIFNGTTWDKVDNTDAVSSVNGFTGAVNLALDNISDVSAASPTNAQLLRFNGTSSLWENWTPTFEPALTKGNLTEATSSVLTITGGTGAVIGSGTTIEVKSAGAAQNGVVTTGTQTLAGAKTLTGALTVSNTINQSVTIATGAGVTFATTTNQVNTTDQGDSTISASHTITASSNSSAVVIRAMSFGSNNNLTGGGAVTNYRVWNVASSTQTGSTTTNLDQIYIERGTASGTVTNNRAILVNNMQGTNQGGLVVNALSGTNNSYVLLGTATIPTGKFGIYQSESTHKNVLFGDTSIGTATSGYALNVSGTANFTGALSGTSATFSLDVATTAGFFNFPNNYGIQGRNAANSAYRTVLKLNASNQIEIGRDSDIAGIILGTASATNALSIASTGAATFSEGVTISKSSNSGSGSVFPRFQVENTLATQGDGSSTFNFADIRIASGNSAVQMFLGTTYAAGTWAPAGIINVSTNHDLQIKTNNTEKMRITSGGDIGIGTSFVSWASTNRRVVEINGTSQVLIGIKVGDVQKGYHYHNGTNLYTENSHSGGDWYLAQVGAGNMIFSTNGSERLRITSGGNIEATGSIKTGTTTTGNASAFKLGARIANTCTVSTTAYLEIELGGTLYYLAFANPS